MSLWAMPGILPASIARVSSDSPVPYLEGGPRARFDAWLEGAVARHSPPLSFAEVRQGVRALSSLWVERRRRAGRALEGAGKRAAFATYYAPLHFLVAWHALRGLAEGAAPAGAAELRRIVDLGCGTGAAGAAAAAALGVERVLACDRSSWALREAARTASAFGLRARTLRTVLPRGVPRLGRGDLAVLGWCANELGPPARAALLATLVEARSAGTALLVLEPLAGAAAPWWDEWVAALSPVGARSGELRCAVELPEWVERLDRAAGLDHAILRARVLCAAAPPPARA
jgi:hypothetical protein